MQALIEQIAEYFPADWTTESLFIGYSESNQQEYAMIKYENGVYLFPIKKEAKKESIWTVSSIRLIDLEQVSAHLETGLLKNTLTFKNQDNQDIVERLFFKNTVKPYVKKQRERLRTYFS
ncbi:hypothetical protein [Atopobacter phocae]|uniref:hypothetical protein n=1 Tax=Atopobacter phocae TaxID=136492 RepID=UPI00047281B2|nr:hypothetical protein [Atopobacter phocae]